MLVMKLILQLALFVAFFKFYSLPALARLGKKSTIVIKTRRNTSGIEAPSITISEGAVTRAWAGRRGT